MQQYTEEYAHSHLRVMEDLGSQEIVLLELCPGTRGSKLAKEWNCQMTDAVRTQEVRTLENKVERYE